MDWNRFDRRLERTVKSLERRLVILRNWADFIMYEVSDETLPQRSITSPLLMRAERVYE